MTDYPMTLDEWRAYIWAIPAGEVWDMANTVNTMRFVTILQEDGLEPDTIEGVFRLFGERIQELGFQLPGRPSGGYLSYVDLMS